jgi:hypothetical protein
MGERNSPAYYEGTFSEDGNTLTGAWHYPGGWLLDCVDPDRQHLRHKPSFHRATPIGANPPDSVVLSLRFDAQSAPVVPPKNRC